MKNFLLTGRPGSGKSTVISKTVSLLREKGVKVGGIYCPEVREGGRRVGFEIRDLMTGERGILAHVDLQTEPHVGKYGVNLETLERMGREGIRRALEGAEVVVVDEIGPMEVLSKGFREAVLQALSSPLPVLAAVHFKTQGGFIGEVKKRKDVKLLEVSPSNLSSLPSLLAGEILGLVRAAGDSCAQKRKKGEGEKS
ncbi:MAG: NTPase [Candidatus Hadarchaeales archaeon]